MKKLALALIVAAGSIACETQGIREVPNVSHKDAGIKVDVITEFDGIRLYKIEGPNLRVYVAKTIDGTQTHWETCDGEGNCDRQEVLTVMKR